MKEKKYTITLNEKQLLLLERMTDEMSRLICGQLDISLKPNAEYAFKKTNRDKGKDISCMDAEWADMSYILEKAIDIIRYKCWGQKSGTYYGIGYDENSDILYDMYQVLRKFRYDNIFNEEEKELMKYTVMADTPMRVSKEPLISVRECE